MLLCGKKNKLPVPQCPHLESKEGNTAYLTEAIYGNYCRECYTISLFNINKLVLDPIP